MSTITINSPARVAAPRGAAIAARWFTALLNGLDALGERRATRRRAADLQADAAQLRSYAQQMAAQDPRFAADLYAAADRHEQR